MVRSNSDNSIGLGQQRPALAMNLNDWPGTQVCTIDVDGVVSNGQKSIAVAVGTEQNSEVKCWKVETTIGYFTKLTAVFQFENVKSAITKLILNANISQSFLSGKISKHFSLLESWLDRLNTVILSSDHQRSTAKLQLKNLVR